MEADLKKSWSKERRQKVYKFYKNLKDNKYKIRRNRIKFFLQNDSFG